jgi:hypothetical protein
MIFNFTFLFICLVKILHFQIYEIFSVTSHPCVDFYLIFAAAKDDRHLSVAGGSSRLSSTVSAPILKLQQ